MFSTFEIHVEVAYSCDTHFFHGLKIRVITTYAGVLKYSLFPLIIHQEPDLA